MKLKTRNVKYFWLFKCSTPTLWSALAVPARLHLMIGNFKNTFNAANNDALAQIRDPTSQIPEKGKTMGSLMGLRHPRWSMIGDRWIHGIRGCPVGYLSWIE